MLADQRDACRCQPTRISNQRSALDRTRRLHLVHPQRSHHPQQTWQIISPGTVRIGRFVVAQDSRPPRYLHHGRLGRHPIRGFLSLHACIDVRPRTSTNERMDVARPSHRGGRALCHRRNFGPLATEMGCADRLVLWRPSVRLVRNQFTDTCSHRCIAPRNGICVNLHQRTDLPCQKNRSRVAHSRPSALEHDDRRGWKPSRIPLHWLMACVL